MKPIRLLATALLIGFTAGAQPSFAQESPAPQSAPMPGTEDVAGITGGSYTVDPDHTQIVWTVDHMGITPLAGMFGASSGTLVLDPTKPEEAKLEITVPISGLRVTSEGFATHLASPELFDAAKFPTASFKSTRVTVEGTDATIEGELTIHGVTKPVTLDTSFFGAGINPMTKAENIGFTATAEIRRSDFGLGFGAPVISDEVALDIVGAFIKQP
ncbi:YceI family protein [Ancylobacter vacuolatus]|uniref:Polyisoprenoid-binding protein YceI n=1 Tax=Ancylobacter vacuolatus TaxID=223389 RepID=A0ABU0DJ73_9HYPH|nr:YceI family protein [Ancylobacter vacuolatus]MDQ0348471.1 polyisoprenoid-binding protein YceI [Ancylobacter vacuolatus]